MERQKHHQEKHGIGPSHHHYRAGAYNKHADNHRYSEEKGGQQMKQDHEYHERTKNTQFSEIAEKTDGNKLVP